MLSFAIEHVGYVCSAFSRGMSHSAMTDMQVIEQEQPNSSRSKYDQFDRKSSKGRSFFDDELDDYTSSSSKYEFNNLNIVIVNFLFH